MPAKNVRITAYVSEGFAQWLRVTAAQRGLTGIGELIEGTMDPGGAKLIDLDRISDEAVRNITKPLNGKLPPETHFVRDPDAQ